MSVSPSASTGLDGEIPTEIGQMVALNWLYLGKLSFFSFVALLSRLTHLLSIHLSSLPGGNAFTGRLPPEIGSLTSLSHLWFSKIQFIFVSFFFGSYPFLFFTFALPRNLCLLSTIGSCCTDGNLLTGPLPDEIGNLEDLESLVFSKFVSCSFAMCSEILFNTHQICRLGFRQ